MASLRGMQQPELSKKLFKMIKSENHTIGAYESASRERISIASQLSDWGEATGDDAISDISDKLGVLLSELGEQEDTFAQNLEDYRRYVLRRSKKWSAIKSFTKYPLPANESLISCSIQYPEADPQHRELCATEQRPQSQDFRRNPKTQIQRATKHQARDAGARTRPSRSPKPRRRSPTHQHRKPTSPLHHGSQKQEH